MAFIFAAALLAMTAKPDPIAIIPKPSSVQTKEGSFRLNSRTSITADAGLGELAHYLQKALAPATGHYLPITEHSSSNTIELRLDKHANRLGAEGYVLSVEQDRVVIRAFKQAGLFYGCQTLRLLLPTDIFRKARVEREWLVPSVTVEDQPRFSWRGAHMDVSRHFMPKEFIFKFLDLMALHKLNTFHWHLTDDNGWRIEIKRYPKLTEVGATTDFSAMNPGGATRSINQEAGGYYSQADVREIVQYAADRHITVVPEIEMPGHSRAANLAYPELGNKAQIAASGGDVQFMGAYDNVFNVEDSTIQFVKNVLDEVIGLFPSKFIHVGGDEVWKEHWKRNPKAQAKMKALKLKNEEELQSWFIKQFDSYLASKKRRLIGWDEILEGGLAPGATVMSWRGTEGGIAAAKAGHDVVMAPNSHTYFDHYQSRLLTREPKAIGGYLPLRKVYDFDPIPVSLTKEQAKHILGGQAQLWSEFIPHPKHMEYMAYPRFCALAEAVWSPKAGRSWDDFVLRLDRHLGVLSTIDVNFRPLASDPKPAAQWRAGEASEKFAKLQWDVSGALSKPGSYDVLFSYTWGENRLDIEWVELVENGKVVQRVEQPGSTGHESKANSYRVRLTQVKPGAKYILRASVRSDGGTKSNGEIYILPAES